MADYTKAIGLNPEFGEAYYNRGIAKEMLRDPDGAMKDWKKAAELGVKNALEYIE